MIRPPVSSSEFPAYFETVVRSSKTREEAACRLGYSEVSIYRHMKRLGITKPEGWPSVPNIGAIRQRGVPEVVIVDSKERPWVGSLVQGEGCFYSHYVKVTNSTALAIDTKMTDPDPIFRLADLFGMSRPSRPKLRPGLKPIWRKEILGLRALRVTHEILPFLFGEKRREAEKAIACFGPRGYHPNCLRSIDVWPSNEFPLRRRHIS